MRCSARGQRHALYVTGEERRRASGAALRRPRTRPLAGAGAGEIQLEKSIATIDATRRPSRVIDSIQTVYSDQLTSRPARVAQVREMRGAPHALLPRPAARPWCWWATSRKKAHWPARACSSTWSTRCCTSKAHALELSPRARHQEPLRRGERIACRNDRNAPEGRDHPSAIFLSQHPARCPAAWCWWTLEGTRPMLVEIQALVDNAAPSPRRCRWTGPRRLAMLLAVLHRHAGVACLDQAVFVNAVGGCASAEPAADMAVMTGHHLELRGKRCPRASCLR